VSPIVRAPEIAGRKQRSDGEERKEEK